MALPMRNVRFIFQFCRRYGVSSANAVRVRFAPSPTGMMHLGGLRTALFNYLFAKSNNGSFLLRIEDTDLTRKVPGAVEKLEDILDWAGLTPDESPNKGGQYGPYIQSERLSLYHDNVNTLLESGHCYRCFCTEKRLSLMKKDAIARQENRKYDNRCRNMTEQEMEKKIAQKVPYVIRFKYEPMREPWTDLVYGLMVENVDSEESYREGDFVVIKSDGYPTYHFANVVDDHHMRISHVLRGAEWSISTPKHLQMYKAFGWEPPLYAHLPLILNQDGTKLSKRQGDIHVEHFKDQGLEPDALLNYLTTVNKGFKGPTDGKTLKELVVMFSLELVNRHSSRLQPEKLPPLNRLHLQRQFSGQQRQNIVDQTRDIIESYFKHRLTDKHILTDHYLESIINWAIEGPHVSEMMEILGRQETNKRLDMALEVLKTSKQSR
ncbi:probable glutamate--tRNA ligase, mitochondrial isoform X2 [Dreissena polymorpha]|uniref:probable glutamate--tRNA ligase, mitochondrial isoform X2 n=1 Tax=Dreissena polymorpha TaxID=45954 RepID=UPI0022640E90|nr:probable glutamate--tRNA ligase, mitochondrial isoform X2 [Dreissena polymorpha]